MSADSRLNSLIATGSPSTLRRHCFSQNRGQTRPMVTGRGMRSLMMLSARVKSPCAAARTYSSTAAWAGQARVQGASQSPVCSLNSRLSAVRRMASTSGWLTSISCPGAGFAEHEGRNLPVFRSRTTQTKQLVVLLMRGSPHSPGMAMPCALAAAMMV